MNLNLSNNNITFGAGVTPIIMKEFACIDPYEIERVIKKNYGTECDFENNTTLAAGTLYALKILREASEKFNLPFKITPPKIKIFKPNELIGPCDFNFGFCIMTKEKVIKKQPVYDERSIFIKNIADNIKSWDSQVEVWYKKRLSSSDNILAPFIHEILHSIHLDFIFEKAKKNPYSRSIDAIDMPFEYLQNKIISEKISSHATVSKFELFSEVLAKIITESLDNRTGTKLVSNPMNKLGYFPKFIQEFIENQLQ